MLSSPLGRDNSVAVANIESASVSFSIIKIHSTSHASIELTRSAEMPLEERTSGQHLFALKQRLLDLSKQTLADYARGKGSAIKRVYCIVHAPWATGTVVKTSLSFQAETYITSAIIAGGAAKALGTSKEQSAYLDARQLPILLNGYKTAYPEGKYAHLLEIAALVSTCEADVRKEIEATIREVIPTAHIAIHSGTRAMVEALEVTRPSMSDVLSLHVSGEGTEVAVFRGGILEQYTYIEEGVRTMLERAFPGVRPEEARTAVRLMQRGGGSDAVKSETEEALLKAEPDIARAFGEGLATISAQLRLPNTVLLIADADIAPWLQRFFERIDFSQFTTTAQPFSVDILSAAEFGSSVEGSESHGDLDIAIAASHVLHEEHRS